MPHDTGELHDEIRARLRKRQGRARIIGDLLKDPNYDHMTPALFHAAIDEVEAAIQREKPKQKPNEIIVNSPFVEFFKAVSPVLSFAAEKAGLVLLDGEQRPVRLTQDGRISVFAGGDELVHFAGRSILDEGYEFVRLGKDFNLSPATVPLNMMKTLLARPDLPRVSSVVRSPFAFQDGFTLPSAGLDGSGRFGAFSPRSFEKYPLTMARAIIDDISGELQFRTESDRANFLGACVTAAIKDALGSSRTPAFDLNAPQPESGKSTAATLITMAREPGDIQKVVPTSQDGKAAGSTSATELEKRFVSAARKRPAIILLDNFDSFAGCDFLENTLTASSFDARILGKSDMFTLSRVPVVIITRNRGSLRFKASFLRRLVFITLEPAGPITGRKWARPNLEDDIRDNVDGLRHRWQDAIASLVFAWIDSGRPDFSGAQLNSFNRWSCIVGGILENAGIHGFLGNRDYQLSFVDPEYEFNAAMIETLVDMFGDSEFRAYDVVIRTEHIQTALEARGLDLGDMTPEPTARAWGRYLSGLVGRVGFRCVLRCTQNREKVNVYRLYEVDNVH